MKEYLKVNWVIFLIFIVFHVLAVWQWFYWSSIAGKAVGITPFDIFSFFNQFSFSVPISGLLAELWNTLLELFVIVMNLFWQLFLANLIYRLIKKIK